jgi:hypothetical protein
LAGSILVSSAAAAKEPVVASTAAQSPWAVQHTAIEAGVRQHRRAASPHDASRRLCNLFSELLTSPKIVITIAACRGFSGNSKGREETP